ncbi:hypothetical protein N0V82_004324 [Gnomoniopsis sp. IMI 355080]|nr:hypothetical protein N0V82_004324 [Gnomoniopsis sp. IMI 355080]
MADSRILELSQRIAANTEKLNSYLVDNDIPQPSFSINAPLAATIPDAEIEIVAARQAIINDTLELHQMVLGPKDYLMSFSENLLVSQQAVARFELAKAFPVGGEITFGELAATVGLGETYIRKLVRHAITQKIFTEVRPGVIAHSACSRLIAEDETVSSYLRFKTDDLWHAAFHLCDAVAKWPGSEEPNQTGFAVAHNTDKTMFDYLSEHPEKAKYFYKAMRAFAQRPGLEPKYVVDNYAWGTLPKGSTVVDVGGSHGIVAIELARAFPALQLVVQDLDEHIIKDADAQKPADVADRVRFMVHDFLTPQPLRASVYFFRMIFHNWPDKYCVKILQFDPSPGAGC